MIPTGAIPTGGDSDGRRSGDASQTGGEMKRYVMLAIAVLLTVFGFAWRR